MEDINDFQYFSFLNTKTDVNDYFVSFKSFRKQFKLPNICNYTIYRVSIE